MVEFQIVSGIAIALLLVVPLAYKWEIRYRSAIPGAVLFGACSGIISYVVDGIFQVASVGQFALQGSTTVMMVVVAAALMFYRDPERVSPGSSDAIVSPADGTILYVKRIKQGKVPLSEKNNRSFRISELAGTGVLSNSVYLVGIGMNLLNVHVNRAPVQGTVKMVHHVPGAFLSLKGKDAILKNERCTTVIDNGDFMVGVIQIASRLVRRIDSYVDEGQLVAKGDRIGIIHFGSQVDLVLPSIKGLDVAVKPGDLVVAGESVMASQAIECRNNGKNMESTNNVSKLDVRSKNSCSRGSSGSSCKNNRINNKSKHNKNNKSKNNNNSDHNNNNNHENAGDNKNTPIENRRKHAV